VGLQVNQPEIRVAIGGVPVFGIISADVERVAFFAADRFSVTFSVDASGQTFSFFSGAGKQLATIDVALQEFGYVELLTGQIDNVYSDLLENKVTVSGRDLSAQLIDTEIAETFANQTSSQIATLICGRHQLTPNVTAEAPHQTALSDVANAVNAAAPIISTAGASLPAKSASQVASGLTAIQALVAFLKTVF